jgi:hypothetical protein
MTGRGECEVSTRYTKAGAAMAFQRLRYEFEGGRVTERKRMGGTGRKSVGFVLVTKCRKVLKSETIWVVRSNPEPGAHW